MSEAGKILIIDDHELYRKGLVQVLNSFEFIKVVGDLSNCRDCITSLKYIECDIILMDLNIPGENSIKTANKIQESHPNIKIVAMADFIEDANKYEIMGFGFDGVITKDIDTAGLKHALQNITKGNKYFMPEIISLISYRPKTSKITKRESEILSYVAKGLTNQKIADTLHVSLRTVTNHRANMHKKIGVRNTIQLLSWGIKNKFLKSIN